MLAENPQIVQRLRDEITERVGSKRAPTYDDLRSMKYLRAFVNEVLRLFPSVPLNVRYVKLYPPRVWVYTQELGRVTSEPTVLPGINGKEPLYIPAGTSLSYCVFFMHRRADLWGPDGKSTH